MTYKSSDIIKKAEQLADLENTDFIGWNEKISLLNDAYTMLYQKLVNIGDGSFVKPMVVYSGENILPPDFWQIKSVNLIQNKIVTPVKRRASSENYSSLSYEVRFDKLYINGTYTNGEIVVEYWAKPKTLTYKPAPVTLQPDLGDRTNVIGVYDEKFFTTTNNIIYMYDCKTSEEKNTETLPVSVNGVIHTGSDYAVFNSTGNLFYLLDYSNMSVTPLTGIPFFTEDGNFGMIDTLNVGRLNGHKVFDWEHSDIPYINLVVCNNEMTDFFFHNTSGDIYHNGELVTLNDEALRCASIRYANGNCWYYSDNEVGYIDSENNVHIVSIKKGIVGINKIDCNTGFGYTIGTTVHPWVEDTVLDFPNSMYFQIMGYMLAVQFKIKQGADASGLLTVLGTLENTFYDTLTQDANDFIRIKNVY